MQNEPETHADEAAPKYAPIHVRDHEDGMRIDRWLKALCPHLAFGQIQKLLRSGQVRVDGKRAKGEWRVSTGQAVRVPPFALDPQPDHNDDKPRERKKSFMSAEEAWDALKPFVIYDDEDLFILNKPTSLAVQGGSNIDMHVDGLLAAMANDTGDRPRLVHRLDQDTSGCLIVARTRPVAVALTESFRNRSVAKTYWAIVEGVPKPPQGRVALPLKAVNVSGEKKMVVCSGHDKEGQRAETVYSVVDKAHGKVAWMSLKPVTGRTHQLRVHMAALETPIIGDRKYGSSYHNDEVMPLHLHARRVQFPHPRNKTKQVDVTAPLPDHMAQTWDRYGFSIKDQVEK